MTEQDTDRSQGFTIPSRHARGRLVRLCGTIDEILSAHAYPPAVEHLLGEALVLTALLGATLKDDGGQMTLQAQTEDGPVELLVCDYRDGQLRGYAKFDAGRLAGVEQGAPLATLFGQGYLAITFDQSVSGERYQGIVPLEGDTLCHAVEAYFAQSEQIPTMIRAATDRTGARHVAAGLMLQHLPHGEVGRERLHVRHDHPEWEHVAIMGGSIRPEELTDRDLSFETLIWRLFNEEKEVRILPPLPLSKGCRCDRAHILEVLGRFPAEERAAMADEHGLIAVDCAFCSHVFEINQSDLELSQK